MDPPAANYDPEKYPVAFSLPCCSAATSKPKHIVFTKPILQLIKAVVLVEVIFLSRFSKGAK